MGPLSQSHRILIPFSVMRLYTFSINSKVRSRSAVGPPVFYRVFSALLNTTLQTTGKVPSELSEEM